MARKQTRRSVSISSSTYERLKVYCDTNNVSMSGLVEAEVGKALGLEPRPPRKAKKPTVLVTKVLSPKTEWKPTPAPNPVERTELIKKAVELSKPSKETQDMFDDMHKQAAKIFTF